MAVSPTPRQRCRGVLLWAGLALAALFPAARADCPFDPAQLSGTPEPVAVRSVTDGDTLVLEGRSRLRLIGVNTPEMGRDGGSPEPYARKAREAVAAFVRNSTELRMVSGREERDNHGRLLGHLFNDRGENLEAHLLARGLGWHVAVPPNLGLAECLARVEATARDRGLGVWRLGPVDAGALDRGGFQRVTGRVGNVSFARAWWLNLDGRLSAVVYPEHQHRFSRDWLASLEGRTVELQGWVYPAHGRRGHWRMKLETGYGIEVAE